MRTRISDEQATKITGKAKYKPRKRSNSGNDQRHKGSLEERILRTMRKLSKENDQDYSETFTDWETPKITWINGVPGWENNEPKQRPEAHDGFCISERVQEHTQPSLIDEAMMNHFGAIITAALLAKAKELLLIGDINQILT
ncbi:hypothetical protein EVAR_85884_1 [Eumeta japonica]|uniref:Uncharacterized protein n=1 Tax=Eumeta variegata TaxID=151549 RepID=A0A4C2A6N6_EUMVA|nr:hypothetical protein EVAR_85884_1 [Eumeta japonica]